MNIPIEGGPVYVIPPSRLRWEITWTSAPRRAAEPTDNPADWERDRFCRRKVLGAAIDKAAELIRQRRADVRAIEIHALDMRDGDDDCAGTYSFAPLNGGRATATTDPTDCKLWFFELDG